MLATNRDFKWSNEVCLLFDLFLPGRVLPCKRFGILLRTNAIFALYYSSIFITLSENNICSSGMKAMLVISRRTKEHMVQCLKMLMQGCFCNPLQEFVWSLYVFSLLVLFAITISSFHSRYRVPNYFHFQNSSLELKERIQWRSQIFIKGDEPPRPFLAPPWQDMRRSSYIQNSFSNPTKGCSVIRADQKREKQN